jgi:hypothetical protein
MPLANASLERVRPPLPMFASGVGNSCTQLGSIRSPLEPRWFGPPFVPSVARGVGISAHTVRPSSALTGTSESTAAPSFQSRLVGVGSSDTVVRRSGPPVLCRPVPFVSDVRGVGSNDEHPFPLVGGADVSGS